MLVYRNFRDIRDPLIVKKTALTEKRAELFSAFPHREILTFTASLDPAFLATTVKLRFRSDDDGRTVEYLMERIFENGGARHDYRATVAAKDLCGEGEDGLFYYHVVADTAYGQLYSHGDDISEHAWFTDDGGYAAPYQLLIYRDSYATPDFLKKGVMYQIMVDRFYRGGNAPPRSDVEMAPSWDAEISQYPAYPGAPLKNNLFYGGDLDGVREKLPYLKSLGVTVLYLCPIFEAYSNHKYDTGDYMRVDPMFGGREALDRLIAAGEENGIRILLDGVFNHTGSISRYFNADGRYESVGAVQSQKSPYYSWYHFDRYPDDYRCWWGVRILPTVNSSNPEYIRFITGEGGVADTYLSAGVSGFRLDVADELYEGLLRALRKRVKSVSCENALIGEVWEDASNKIAYDKRRRYFRGEELDSVMNYPLKNAILDFLLSKNAEAFSKETRRIYAHYPRFVSESLMNLLGTHDTERILSVLGGQDISGLSYAEMKDLHLSADARALASKRLRLAYAILAIMPGIPCIYYGDEAGMEGAKDPFNRRTFPWGKEDQALLAFFRRIGKIRTEQEDILMHGYYRVLYANGGMLVFCREDEKAGTLLLCLNAEDTPVSYPLDGSYTDLLTEETVKGTLHVSSLDFRLLHKKAHV